MSISVEDWDDIAEAPREESRRRGKRRAEKKQAAAEKAQAAPKPAPAPKAAPVAQEPAPAPKPRAAPVAQKPVAQKPATKPKPVAQKPATDAEKPAPVVEKPAPVVEKPAPVVEKPAPVVEKPAPEPAPVAQKPAPAPKATPEPVAAMPEPEPALVALAVAEKPAPAPQSAPVAEKPVPPAPEPEHHTPALAPVIDPDADFFPLDDMHEVVESSDDGDAVDEEPNDTPLQRRLRGRKRDAAPTAETWAAYAPEIPPADAVIATAELQEAAASVDDWDELSAGPPPRRLAALARAAAAPTRRGEKAEADFGTAPDENLRLPLCLAAGNMLIWLLARLSGVVELIGVSFAASVGMLLAAYVLREWQKDRSALIYLVGALPLPITIFALIA